MVVKFNPGPFPTLVNTDDFATVSIILSILSLFVIAFFIVCEFQYSKKRSILDEILLSLTGSILLGVGITFTLLSFGLYF